MSALLEIAGLTLRLTTPRGPVTLLQDIALTMGHERVGVIGPSGSGKSMLARCILRLLPPGASLSATRLAFAGQDLLGLDARAMRSLRGRRIALVQQDPRFSLNPMMTLGAQVAEACRQGGDGRAAARARTLALFEAVRLAAPRRVASLYPHQVSGGMGQRAMIAMMLAGDPELLVADEPTSALDATARVALLELLDELRQRRGMGIILITHDLHLASRFCDRILVMGEGRIVEHCAAVAIEEAQHPLTRRLLAARPRLAS